MINHRDTLNSGDTPLHTFVRNCTTVRDFAVFIQQQDFKIVQTNAITRNAENALPLDLIRKDITKAERHELVRMLLTLTTTATTFLPFDQAINVEQVKLRFGFAKNSTQEQTLRLACEMANITRHRFKRSITFPYKNGMTLNTMKEMEASVKKDDSFDNVFTLVRHSYTDINFSFRNKTLTTLALTITPERCEQTLKMLLALNLKENIANCGDISHCLLYYLFQYHREMLLNGTFDVGIYAIAEGDHSFVVFNARNTPPARWTKDVIVCDAFSGEIYPGNEVMTTLRDYRTFTYGDMVYNLYPKYNPASQTIVREKSITSYPIFYDKKDFATFTPPLLTFIENISDAMEYFEFRETASEDVNIALQQHLITQDELNLFANNIPVLTLIFNHRHIIPLLTRQAVRLAALATLSDEEISNHLNTLARACSAKRFAPPTLFSDQANTSVKKSGTTLTPPPAP